MVYATNVERAPMLPMISEAIKHMFHNPTHPFLTAQVMDILFRGIPVDCDHTSSAAVAVCTLMESDEIKATERLNSTHMSFAMFKFVCIFVKDFICISQAFGNGIQNVSMY